MNHARHNRIVAHSRLVLAMLLMLSPTTISMAATKFWKNSVASGNWTTGNSWSNVSAAGADNGGAPLAGDTVNVAPTDGAAHTVTYDYAGAPISLGALTFDLTGAGTNRTTFNMPANNLTAIGFLLGNSGRATLSQSGGAFTTNDPALDSVIGNLAGSNGIYNLSGTGSLSIARDLYVGAAGTGTFNQTTGTNSIASTLRIGASGAYNLSGGTLRFNGYTKQAGGTINYTAGTVRLAGDRDFSTDVAVGDFFGAITTITAGKELVVEGGVQTLETVHINGGRLTGLAQLNIHLTDVTNGGTISGATVILLGPGANLASGAGSKMTSTGAVSVGALFLGVGNLTVRDQALVHAGTFLNIYNDSTLNMLGGTIRFDQYIRSPTGTFNYQAGTIQLAGNRTFGTDAAISELFGGAPTVPLGKGLTVEGTATIAAATALDGGTLSVNAIQNGQNLQVRRGVLNVSNQAITIVGGGALGGTLEVPTDMTVNVTLGVTNQGLVTGDGQIGGQFVNAAAGELRADAGKSLTLTGAGNNNAGLIRLLGGSLDFQADLTNSANGMISGNGSLLTGTLTNHGTMNFAGTANIAGNVTNSATGRVISGGGGATIFYDDVVNNGEIRTSTNGFTVFFGSVSGSGTFTGTGTVNFEGDLNPGSSPAAVNFAGDVTFGAAASLAIEIGGMTAGTQHDKLSIGGDLTLDGALNVSLINGFIPAAGQSFNILDWGGLAGSFSSLSLPTLAGLTWNTSQLYTTGVLSVVAGLPGDYNEDGAVDAADYTRWRDSLGSLTSLPNDDTPGVGADDYARWKANFGRTPGAGRLTGPDILPIPEPSTTAFAALALGLAIVARRAQGI